jgi:3-methyladenine DNA glycosylase/8-oxoguanine DNA glycosylase
MEHVSSLFGGQLLSPIEVLAVQAKDLRAAGFPRRKVATIRDPGERFFDGRLDIDGPAELSDDDFIAELTAVPDIGS